MVRIISGNPGSGKTTRLTALYEAFGKGDGFAVPKVFISGNYAGQEVLRFSTGERVPLSFIEGFLPEGFRPVYRHGPYRFSREGFDFARRIVSDIVRDHIKLVFIDEIGPLELKGKGFAGIFSLLLEKSEEMYCVIRSACLEEAIEKFRISKYKVVKM